MAEKQLMQADGAGTQHRELDENGEQASRRRRKGESGGGAYPNPHTGKSPAALMGQSGRAYHGIGQLGDEKTSDQNSNSPSTI